jgi:hypothetical protein
LRTSSGTDFTTRLKFFSDSAISLSIWATPLAEDRQLVLLGLDDAGAPLRRIGGDVLDGLFRHRWLQRANRRGHLTYLSPDF